MTTLFPHASYAEDQPYSKPILAYHVLSRGFLVGSSVSLLTAIGTSLISRSRSPAASPFLPRLILHTTRGSVIGTALTATMLFLRMRNREKIEWQDRAWRLQENEGQTS